MGDDAETSAVVKFMTILVNRIDYVMPRFSESRTWTDTHNFLLDNKASDYDEKKSNFGKQLMAPLPTVISGNQSDFTK